MSEQNAQQSVDILMDILQLVLYKWVRYYRELGEISKVQASVDAVDAHLDVTAFQYYPLEHTLTATLESMIDNKTIDLEFVKLASKYAAVKSGEELIATVLYEELNGKTVSQIGYDNFIKTLNTLRSKAHDDVANFVVSRLAEPKRLETAFGKDFADLVNGGKLDKSVLIQLTQLNDAEQKKVVSMILDHKDDPKINDFTEKLMDAYGLDLDANNLVDSRTRSFLETLSGRLDRSVQDIKLSGEKKVSDAEISKALKKSEFMKGFVDDSVKQHFNHFFLYDNNGNERSYDERRSIETYLINLATKRPEELTEEDKLNLGYAHFCKMPGGVLDVNGRKLHDAVATNHLNKLENIKHGKLKSTWFGEFSVKYDINGKIITENMLTKDVLENTKWENNSLKQFSRVIAQTIHDAEVEIIKRAKETGNFSELRGFDLAEYLVKDLAQMDFTVVDKDGLASLIKSTTFGVSGLNLERMLVGFQHAESNEWVVPWDIIQEDHRGRWEMLTNSFINNSDFLNAVWEIDVDKIQGIPETEKTIFIEDRAKATRDYIQAIANNNEDLDVIKGIIRNYSDSPISGVMIGYAIDCINRFDAKDMKQALIDLDLNPDAMSEEQEKEFVGMYEDVLRFNANAVERA